jgi:hypothetical protein
MVHFQTRPNSLANQTISHLFVTSGPFSKAGFRTGPANSAGLISRKASSKPGRQRRFVDSNATENLA